MHGMSVKEKDKREIFRKMM